GKTRQVRGGGGGLLEHSCTSVRGSMFGPSRSRVNLDGARKCRMTPHGCTPPWPTSASLYEDRTVPFCRGALRLLARGARVRAAAGGARTRVPGAAEVRHGGSPAPAVPGQAALSGSGASAAADQSARVGAGHEPVSGPLGHVRRSPARSAGG